MTGCLLVLIALIVPRLLMFFIWVLTGWFGRAFESWFWPVLGFVCMPYTTLAYMAAMLNNNRALTGGWLALLIVGVIADVTHWHIGSGRSVRHLKRLGRPRVKIGS